VLCPISRIKNPDERSGALLALPRLGESAKSHIELVATMMTTDACFAVRESAAIPLRQLFIGEAVVGDSIRPHIEQVLEMIGTAASDAVRASTSTVLSHLMHGAYVKQPTQQLQLAVLRRSVS